MKHSIITITAILIICASASVSFAQPQPPDTLWTRVYGGIWDDKGYSVQQTIDSGYVIVGHTDSYGVGGYDVFLIKTDASGIAQWTQTLGESDYEVGKSVQQTSDGGYIIAGSTESYGAGGYDVYLIKTDANGNESWYQTFGGSDIDCGYNVQQTSDGGYIIAGCTWSYSGAYDVYLIKTDTIGNESWSKTFGGSDSDFGWSVQQTSDGGYIIAGNTYSYGAGSSDVYLIKTNASGDTTWTKTYGGSSYDDGNSVQQTMDGGYIICGKSGSVNVNVYLIKTDSIGNAQWTQIYGGSDFEEGKSVQQTSDGGYFVAGYTNSYGAGDYDIYLIKTDSTGNTQWTLTYGGSDVDYGYSGQQTSDCGYVVAGYTASCGAGVNDVYLIKIAPEDAVIQVEPVNYNFGLIDIGYPGYFPVQISNDGWGELTISDFLLSPPFSCAIVSGDSTLSYGDTTIVEITFDPPEIGYYVDSLGIVSNAVNEDTVWVYLEGEGGIVPAPVQGLTIEVIGNDAVLTWNPVDTTIHGNPVVVDYYLIYFETDPYSEFEFLDYTADTVFTHDAVAQFSESMFYEVIAFIGDIEMRIKN